MFFFFFQVELTVFTTAIANDCGSTFLNWEFIFD